MIRKQTHGNERDKPKKKTNANGVAENVKSGPEQRNPTDPYEMLGISRVNVNEHRRIARRIWYNEFIERLIKDASQKGRKKKKVHFDDVLQTYRNLLEREASDEFDRVVRLARARCVKSGLSEKEFWNEWCRLICKHQRAQGYVVEETAGEGAEKKAKARFEYLLELLKELQDSGLDKYVNRNEKARFDGNLAKAIASYSEIIVEDQGWDYFRSKGKFYRPRTYMTPSGLFDYKNALLALKDPEVVIAIDYMGYVDSKANYEDLKSRFREVVKGGKIDLILDGEIRDLWKEYGFYDARKNAEKCIVAMMDALEPVHFELKDISTELQIMLSTNNFDLGAQKVKEIQMKIDRMRNLVNMFDVFVRETRDRLLVDTEEVVLINEVKTRMQKNLKYVNDSLEAALEATKKQYQKQQDRNQVQKKHDTIIKKKSADFIQKDQQKDLQDIEKLKATVSKRVTDVLDNAYLPRLGVTDKRKGKHRYQQNQHKNYQKNQQKRQKRSQKQKSNVSKKRFSPVK